MFAYNLIPKTFLILNLLIILQTEGKRVNHKSEKGGKDYQSRTTLHGLKLKKLHGLKHNKTELGHRRQYLTPDNELSQTVSPQQDENLPNPLIAQDNVDPSQDIPSQVQDDSFVKQNLPLAGPRLAPQAVPIEMEKSLPIPFSKPDIRLVPKLYPLRYTKKPDVHVAHIHFEQGGKLLVQFSCLLNSIKYCVCILYALFSQRQIFIYLSTYSLYNLLSCISSHCSNRKNMHCELRLILVCQQ